MNLSVDIGGIKMKNPVACCSGTFGYGAEYNRFIDLNRLGAIITKGTTLQPRQGNPAPRIAETPSGMLNAIGLENPGVEAVISQHLPFLSAYDVPVIINISGDTVEDYVRVASMLDGQSGVAGIEVNISCPNVKKGGMQFGGDPDSAAEVTGRVRQVFKKTLIVKLSPNVNDIAAVADKVAGAGADALSLINTLVGMVIDIKQRRPVLANITGGLSGPAIRPVAVRTVWQVYQAVKIPIIGMGGITCAEDALQFIMAGASAVAIGTANFVNPRVTMDVLEGIEDFMQANGIADIRDLTGAAQAG